MTMETSRYAGLKEKTGSIFSAFAQKAAEVAKVDKLAFPSFRFVSLSAAALLSVGMAMSAPAAAHSIDGPVSLVNGGQQASVASHAIDGVKATNWRKGDLTMDKIAAQQTQIGNAVHGPVGTVIKPVGDHSHVQGNFSQTSKSSLSDQFGAVPAHGTHSGVVKAVSSTEVIQHVGRGQHVSWNLADLKGDTPTVGADATISKDGMVRVAQRGINGFER